MSWQTELVAYLRNMIFDVDSTNYTYTDTRLQTLLCTAAQFVETELDFTQSFQADPVAITITPDPTDNVSVPSTRDDSFINLVCLKAACIIDRGEARTAIAQAVHVRDGTSAIDLRGVMQGRLAILSKGGWCSAYDDAKTMYMLSKTHVAGAAIMTPFRVWAGDGRTIWPNAGFMDFRP